MHTRDLDKQNEEVKLAQKRLECMQLKEDLDKSRRDCVAATDKQMAAERDLARAKDQAKVWMDLAKSTRTPAAPTRSTTLTSPPVPTTNSTRVFVGPGGGGKSISSPAPKKANTAHTNLKHTREAVDEAIERSRGLKRKIV